MFLLKKLITPFMLPPGLFVSLLLLTAFWALRRKKHWTAVLAGGMGAAIWLLSVGPTADYLMGTLESGITVPADPQGDAIIMLGGGVHARAPDLCGGTGAPSRNTLERLVAGCRFIVNHRRCAARVAGIALLPNRLLKPIPAILIDSFDISSF